MRKRILAAGLLVLPYFCAVAQVPTITSFSPTSGPVGTPVTITGTNFSATPASNIVFFGATQATVTNATATTLTVTVPLGATFKPMTVLVNGLLAYSRMPFAVTFNGNTGFDVTSLAAKTDFSLSAPPDDVAIGDFDGDGKPDMALTSSTVEVLRNTSSTIGSISYAAGAVLTAGSQPWALAIGDLDGDGKVDLAAVNLGSGNVSVFRNVSGGAGSISFSTKFDFSLSSTPYSISIGDLDGDGKADLAVANGAANTVSVLRNISSGPGSINYASKVDFNTASFPQFVSIGDLDGDGKPDLVTANSVSDNISVLRNTSGGAGSIAFATKVDFSTQIYPISVAIGDLDNDGKPDLAVANKNSISVSVLRSTSTPGNISFPTKTDFPTTSGPTSVAITNLDGDSRADLAVTNFGSGSTVSVLRNTSAVGSISYVAGVDFATGPGPYTVSIGDLDSDGRPDLAVANSGSANVSTLRNTVLAPEPTAQPSALTFFHITSTAFDASWTEPNPVPNGYLAVMSANLAPTFIPVDGTTYSYNQVVGAVSGNNMYVVQNTSEPGIDLVSLTAGQTIHVKVYAFNGTGPTINYLTTAPLTGSQTPTADLDKPVAANATSATVVANTNLVFKANLTDATSGVDIAEVEFRPITAIPSVNFQVLQMLPTTGSSFEIELPADQVGELGVEYRFNVADFQGNDNSLAQTTYTTRVRHDDGLIIPYTQPGITVAAYRIIAVPLILDDKSVNSVMGNKFGAYDPTVYAAYYWNGTRLEELNDETQLTIGRGYWFITGIDIFPGIPTGPGVTPDVSPSNPFQITLTPGWNQIGNPYNFNISWADILLANPTKVTDLGANSKIRVWRGGPAAENVDELVTFEGGFVKNTNTTSSITINIPVAKNPAINSRKAIAGPLSNPIDQPNWEIMFNLSQGELKYNLGGLGMRTSAEVEYDEYDDFNLPRFFDYLEVKFPKERVGMTYTKDIVPTSANHVWPFTIESNLAEGPITIAWDNSYFGSGKEIFLVDLSEHRAINMSEVEKYTFSSSPSRPFKVVYGDTEFVKNEILPGQPVLFTPYPNPFAERVTIGYSLPKDAVTQAAALDIYNNQGARVSSLNLPAQPGEGSWEWVSEQAPGMYFVRLRIGDQTVIRKLIKR